MVQRETANVNQAEIPPELMPRKSWVLWRTEQRNGECTKVPYAVSGQKAESNNPETWTDYDTAAERFAIASGFDGLGFVFSADDPFCGVDLDGCRDPQTGDLAPWAATWVAKFDTYTEVSPSRTGVKLWCVGQNPKGTGGNIKVPELQINGKKPGVEIYDRLRYFAVTGWHVPGTPRTIEPRQSVLNEFVATYWPAVSTSTPTATGKAPLDVTERAGKYLAKIPGAVSGQGGHDATFHAACCLVLGFALTPDQAYPLLAEWNTTCQPPWSEKELRHKLADANKQGGPRGWILDERGYTGPDVGLRRMTSGEQGEQAAGATPQAERPKILITAAEHEVNDAALAALASDPGIYQRGGALVHVVQDAGPDDGIDRRGQLPRIATLPEMALRERLTRCAQFRQLRKTDDGFAEVDAHPPMWCYRAILDRGAWDSIPRLIGVVPSPVLRGDGSVLRRAGFDRKTGLFCAFDDPLELPEHPTQQDATAAAERLLDVVCDFPFGRPAHRAAWLACVLTPLARYAFAGPAPLFLFDANVRGSGKTLLGELVSLIDYGRDIARMANPRNDDEARKRITALALAGDPLVQIDNVVGQLGCASLDAALTGTVWKDRILGSSTIVELPLCVTWLASGNNVMLAADTSRRVLHIRLESDRERPEDRTGFKFPDIRQHVHRHRAELLASALTILSAYSQAGRPPQGLTPWGSFEGWSAVVREAVVWAGLPDPGETRQELVETADREAGALRELLETWGQIDPDGYGMTAAEIADRLRASGDSCREFRAALLELCPPGHGDLPSVRQIGNQFSHIRRRVIGGKALDFRERRGRRRAWFVVQTGDCGDSGASGDSSQTLRGTRAGEINSGLG